MALNRDVVLCCISLWACRGAVSRSWASGCMSVWVLSCALKRCWALGSISLWAFRLFMNMTCVLGCMSCEFLAGLWTGAWYTVVFHYEFHYEFLGCMSTWSLCGSLVGYFFGKCFPRQFWRNSYPSWRVHYGPFWLSRPRHWNPGGFCGACPQHLPLPSNTLYIGIYLVDLITMYSQVICWLLLRASPNAQNHCFCRVICLAP